MSYLILPSCGGYRFYIYVAAVLVARSMAFRTAEECEMIRRKVWPNAKAIDQ